MGPEPYLSPRLKLRFIFNPRSGRNARRPHLFEYTREFIRQHGLDARVVSTTHPHHATDLARQAVDEGCEVVVAIGGDGTMNEVGAALIGMPATLGLIPCGSGNGLGRHLGIPGPGRGAYHTLLHGIPRLIDTGTVNGRPFFNAMGLGFDAEISDRFTRVSRRGLPAYVRTGISAWMRYQPVSVRITGEDRQVETEAFIVAIANSDQYGNDCYIAPGAQVDDGRLDLTLLRPVRWWQALALAAKFFRGRIDGDPRIIRLRDRAFVIERDSAGLVHTDGEPFVTDARVSVEVRPRSLRVLVPPVQPPRSAR